MPVKGANVLTINHVLHDSQVEASKPPGKKMILIKIRNYFNLVQT